MSVNTAFISRKTWRYSLFANKTSTESLVLLVFSNFILRSRALGNNPYKIVGYKKHCAANGIQFTVVTETTIDREIFGALIDDAYDGNLYVRGVD